MILKPILAGNVVQTSGGVSPFVSVGRVANIPGSGWKLQVGQFLNVSGGPSPVTIISVTGASTTELLVTWTPGAILWNNYVMEVYEDAGLTILNQTINQFALVGATSVFVSSLDVGTQYWIRMKVRDDGGIYSAWSNTGTGTTVSDPLAGVLDIRFEGDQITGLSNGDPVPLWPNTGNNGAANDAVQADVTKQPIWNAADAAFNGQSTVTGDATNDVLNPSIASAANPFTAVFVYKNDGTPNTSVFQSNTGNVFIAINRNSFAVFNGAVIVNDTTPYASAAHIFSMEIGVQSKFYVDGVDVTGSTGVTGDWPNIVMGFSASTGQIWGGTVAAWGMFNSVDTVKRQLVEATWKAKYGTS